MAADSSGKRGEQKIEGLKSGQAVYSHSRISTFEQCPLRFKYSYIDKLETEISGSIEAFMGSRVHDALEKLYKDLKFEKENSAQEIVDFYNEEWTKHWNDKILVVRAEYDSENYRKIGERCIIDYYNRYRPFRDGRTIGLEIRVVMQLDNEKKYVLQGFIDRLTDAGEGTYEIHDYKTGNSLPDQEKLDLDRQLALYSIAVKEMYHDCRKVILVWHYLAFDKELRSERSTAQLEKLRTDTIGLIKRIESAQDYPAQESMLCEWCQYRALCPRWKHLYETKELAPEEFKKNDGVKMVDEYAILKNKEREVADAIEKLNAKIISYSEQMGVDKVFGSDSRVTIWKKMCVKFPGKQDPNYTELVKILRDAKAWEEFNTLDKWKLEKAFEEMDMDYRLMEEIAKYGKRETLKKLYFGKR
jgi:putative RecB family exonuclease